MVDLSSVDTKKSREELLALRAKRSQKLKTKQFFGVAVAAAAIIVLITALLKFRGELASSPDWFDQLQAITDQHSAWLARHGIGIETFLYTHVADVIQQGIVILIGPEKTSFADKLFFSIGEGVLRVLLLMIASIRIFLFAGMIGAVYGAFRRTPHEGNDLLGVTGNGGLFFSGVKTSIEDVHAEKLIPGLACPPIAEKTIIEKSALYQILKGLNALNPTTEKLAGIIIAHPQWPGFLPKNNSDQFNLDTFIEPITLPEYASIILQATLSVHAGKESALPVQTGKHSITSFGILVEKNLLRVLTPDQKKRLHEMPATVIAALVLAIEAGKVLSFEKEGTRWIRRSLFPQLAARSVLHSIPETSVDFSGDERSLIRRALVYASRLSVMGPVRFPVDLSEETAALRQWSELLLSPPHTMEIDADEVGFYGFVSEGQRRFGEAFLRSVSQNDQALLETAIATDSVCFFSVTSLLHILRKALSSRHREHIIELAALLGARAKVSTTSADDIIQEAVKPSTTNLIVPDPLTLREITDLSHFHDISHEDVKEWAGLRSILMSYGWLSRRVGQSLIPESSIVFCSFRTNDPQLRPNQHGYFGKRGMVPMRASRLKDRFQQGWRNRFISVDGAEAAETPAQFEKLLRGEVDSEMESVG